MNKTHTLTQRPTKHTNTFNQFFLCHNSSRMNHDDGNCYMSALHPFGHRGKCVGRSCALFSLFVPILVCETSFSMNHYLVLSTIKCGDSYFHSHFFEKKMTLCPYLVSTNISCQLASKEIGNLHIHSGDVEQKSVKREKRRTKFIGNESIACDFHEMTWKI